jgi:hypothetical protein
MSRQPSKTGDALYRYSSTYQNITYCALEVVRRSMITYVLSRRPLKEHQVGRNCDARARRSGHARDTVIFIFSPCIQLMVSTEQGSQARAFSESEAIHSYIPM